MIFFLFFVNTSYGFFIFYVHPFSICLETPRIGLVPGVCCLGQGWDSALSHFRSIRSLRKEQRERMSSVRSLSKEGREGFALYEE